MRSLSLGAHVRGWVLLVLLPFAMLACTHDGVVAFNVKPPLVCPGKTVDISWQVQGRAQLKATPPPPNWNEQIPSQGSLSAVRVSSDMTFVIIAPDANQARGRSYAMQTAQVTAQEEPRAAKATCTDAGVCTGEITINADSSVRVSKLANPAWRSGFKLADHEVCVTPPTGNRICVAPKSSAPLDLPANGKWLFDMKLAEGESGDPPPLLRVEFDFGCK